MRQGISDIRPQIDNTVINQSPNPRVAPVAIGGVGGSGTRLVQHILEGLGYDMGSDLNIAHDNLWFTFLFLRPNLLTDPGEEFDKRAGLFRKAMRATGGLTPEDSELIDQLVDATVKHGPMSQISWLQERADSLKRAAGECRSAQTGRWGWKEPNTHVMLDGLTRNFPDMKYIHVIRNGLDMAFADKQNQPFLWGPALFGMNKTKRRVSPRYSLKFWCKANRRALRLGKDMGDNFFLLNFDDLCARPAENLTKLLSFLGIDPGAGAVKQLCDLVNPPASIGRFKEHSPDEFDPRNIRYVASLGFDTSWDVRGEGAPLGKQGVRGKGVSPDPVAKMRRGAPVSDDKVLFMGGVGGSGTRAVADAVGTLGVFMGHNLNNSLDNLDWPSSQYALLVRDRSISDEEKLLAISDAFHDFAEKMRAGAGNRGVSKIDWGTKVPGSFYYLPYLSRVFSNMRYIHVIRHGLDMAFSDNHNQMLNWGGVFNLSTADGATPRTLLKYWAHANTLAMQHCETWLPGRYLVIRFEDLCAAPAEHVRKMADFLGIEGAEAAARIAQRKIVQQQSQDRYKLKARADMFDDCDIAALGRFGFSADLD